MQNPILVRFFAECAIKYLLYLTLEKQLKLGSYNLSDLCQEYFISASNKQYNKLITTQNRFYNDYSRGKICFNRLKGNNKTNRWTMSNLCLTYQVMFTLNNIYTYLHYNTRTYFNNLLSCHS